MTMDAKTHWETIYTSKAPSEVSWFQARPLKSMDLIRATGIEKDAPIIDVGGGASTLADSLLDAGYRDITILDISSAALEKAKTRLGARSATMQWIEGDVTTVLLSHYHFDLWHDRAVFHFLTSPEDRKRYLNSLRTALKPGGHVVMATFAIDGPPRCSGLDVIRYSPDTLTKELGHDFSLLSSDQESHQTPFGTAQNFIYCHFQHK